MPQVLSRCVMLVVILFGLLAIPSGQRGQADAIQSIAAVPLANPVVTLVSPAACPPSGCSAGQRLNYKVDFSVTKTDPARNPNLQVCFYFPINWSVTMVTPAGLDSIHSTPFSTGHSNCDSAPANYNLEEGAVADVLATTASESLAFSFRLGAGASNAGSVLVRIFERDNTNTWSKTGEVSSALTVAASAASVFVANDAAACGASTPCYINSLDDLDVGYGTGLKDAVDIAASTTITVLGQYSIKKNSILVDNPVVLKSSGGSKITYKDTSLLCTQPMLWISAGASLSGVSIDEGDCRTTSNTTSNHRNLVLVDSPNPVLIESSDLKLGLDAIHVTSANVGNLTVRYNEITANSGWAIYLESNSTAFVLNAYANNLSGNKTDAQVECNIAAKGVLDHNFWGTGVFASSGASHCTVNDAKRLGAPITTSSPGVQAQKVMVGAASIQYQYRFSNKIGYQRTGSGNDFGLVIVNHGFGGVDNIPFKTGLLGNPIPCSNFYDIFLEDATAPASPATLKLFFKYDLNAGCITNIESPQYCGQTAASSQFPLYWFSQSANDWKSTGAGGQPTVCRTDANKDIQVTIDNSTTAHPNFSDLARLPFVVALPGQLVVTSLTALPGSNQAAIQWVTADETNIAEFHLQRRTAATDFVTIGNPFPILGSGTTGATYNYTDSGLVNNTTYYYRLEIKHADASLSYTSTILVTPIASTSTPSLVPSKTLFPTSTVIYKSPTPTWTFTPTPTSPFKTITSTPPLTPTSLTRTPTKSPTLVATTQLPATALAQTRAARTEIVRLSFTPTPTLTPTPIPVSKQAEPLTAVMAILAAGTLAGGAFFLIREHFHSR